MHPHSLFGKEENTLALLTNSQTPTLSMIPEGVLTFATAGPPSL